jgi:hypothetical protein
LTVSATPAILGAIPKDVVIRIVRAYRRGSWKRANGEDRAMQAGRPGFLTGCYTYAGVRVHVITGHRTTRVMLAGE